MKPHLDIHLALKALAHPGRLDFLIWLRDPERYFGLTSTDVQGGVPAGRFELEGLSQSAVSQNLAILRRAGLVSSRKERSTILYRRNEENLATLKLWLASEI